MDSEILTNYKNEKFTCTCKPKFLLILKGKIIGEVDGVNVPLLIDKIMKNIPYWFSIQLFWNNNWLIYFNQLNLKKLFFKKKKNALKN